MTETRPLFRPEAIEAHARGRGVEDADLELKEERTIWAFRILLLLLAVTLVVGFTWQVDQTARGPARSAGSSATVELPVAALPRLHVGQHVTLHGAPGNVDEVGAPTARGDVAVVVVHVAFSGPVSDGEATVLLNRQTLADLVMRRG